jgi:hypothetical protein
VFEFHSFFLLFDSSAVNLFSSADLNPNTYTYCGGKPDNDGGSPVAGHLYLDVTPL